ncbi:hypothetical protein [Streptomyces sp. NPDC048623]|uniref:hypothetical protein n=1 Tax=Streptomyces sp. NPDC048623 TaxID=3155761 RepID=UPI003418C1E0
MAAGEVPAAAGAAPDSGSSGQAGGTTGPVSDVRPVDSTPGVRVLRAIAAEAPEWTITQPGSLRDQGLMATGLLESGFTPQEIRHALLSRKLPQPLLTTVGAVVSRRLRDLLAVGPAAGVRPIPAQQAGDYDLVRPEPEDQTPVPVSWADRRAQLEAEASGRGLHRSCAGDDGLCQNLAVPGEDLCLVCSGADRPECADGCGRGVLARGMRCLVCDAPEELGVCPGHGGTPCGRPVQTEGLCGRCRIAAEKARAAADAQWEAARDAAVAAAQAQEAASAPF